MELKMTPALRKSLAGFLSFDEGESVDLHLLPEPITDENGITVDPVVMIKIYTQAELKERRAPQDPEKTFCQELVELFQKGAGIVGWHGMLTANGKELPFSIENIAKLADNTLTTIDAAILEYVRGVLTPKEKLASE